MQAMFDPIGLKMYNEMVANATTMRRNVLDAITTPKRDINTECGYPEDINAEMYRDMYDRLGVAARVNDLFPLESWLTTPEIFESEDAEDETPFELSWKEMCQALRGKTMHTGDEGNAVWEYLQRIDSVSGIGRFGALLIGFDDVKAIADLANPVEGLDERGESEGFTAVKRKVLFLRVFDESLVQVYAYETDPYSPRFGLPTLYHITFNDPRDSEDKSAVGMTPTTLDVHWTRIIHVADNLLSSESFGSPRMEPVFNHLVNIRKVYGGDAEGYWKGAFPGLSIESHPQLGADVIIDKTAVREELDNYQNRMQRFLIMNGLSAKSLSPQVVDPTPHVEIQIEAICISLGVPLRIFKGSERGELSSSQDTIAWNGRIMGRQTGYITPRIIVPFVSRLIFAGALVRPQEGYTVKWDDMNKLTPDQLATVAQKRAQAMSLYANSAATTIMTPLDFLTREMGYSDDEAMQINDNADQAAQDKAIEDAMNADLNQEPTPNGPNPNGDAATGVQQPGQSQVAAVP